MGYGISTIFRFKLSALITKANKIFSEFPQNAVLIGYTVQIIYPFTIILNTGTNDKDL